MKNSDSDNESLDSPRAQRRLLLVRVAALVVGSLLVLAAVLWTTRDSLAENLLHRAASQLGAPTLQFKVEAFERDSLRLREITLGRDADFYIEQLSVSYTAASLLRGEILLLEVSKLRVRGEIVNGELRFDSRDSILAELEPNDSTAAAPGGAAGQLALASQLDEWIGRLPVRRVVLDRLRAEIQTVDGPFYIDLNAALDRDHERLFSGQVAIQSQSRRDEFAAKVKLDLRRDATSFEGTVEFSSEAAEFSNAESSVSGFSAQARLDFELTGDRLEIRSAECMRLGFESLKLPWGLEIIQPIALCLRVSRPFTVAGLSQLMAGGAGGSAAFEPNAEFLLESSPFALTLESDESRLRLIGETPETTLRIAKDRTSLLGLQIAARNGTLTIPLLQVEFSGIGFTTTLYADPLPLKASLSIDKITSTGPLPEFPPLVLAAQLKTSGVPPAGDSQDGDIQIDFEVEIEDRAGISQFAFVGSHRLALGSGRSSIRMTPMNFSSDGPQLADLMPDLAGKTVFTSGGIEIEGEARWNAEGEIDVIVDLTFVDLHGTTPELSFEGLSGTIQALGPFSPSTPPGQTLRVDAVDFGALLEEGSISFQILPTSELILESMDWRFAEGGFKATGEYHPPSGMGQLEVEFEAVSVAELIELSGMEGLSGTGFVSGKLPMKIVEDEIEVLASSLSALQMDGFGGWIFYTPASVAAIAQSNAGLAALYGALENFHYTELEVKIAGRVSGEVDFGIHLKGANPDYQSGQLVEFNLSVNALFSDLVRGATTAYELPEKIGKILSRRVAAAQKDR